MLIRGNQREIIVPLAEVPITFRERPAQRGECARRRGHGGCPRASRLKRWPAALRTFGHDPTDNPGRANPARHRGRAYPARLCPQSPWHGGAGRAGPEAPGQAAAGHGGSGGRPERRGHPRSWRAPPGRFGRITWWSRKWTSILRGRAVGEVPALLADEFSRLGSARRGHLPRRARHRRGADSRWSGHAPGTCWSWRCIRTGVRCSSF